MSTSDIAFLRKLAEIKRTGQFKISMEQLRRLDHIKQGQFTATITEEEEAMPPRFQTDIQDAEVFVAEGEPAMFECRVEPKHDLNLSVRWYRNEEELVSGGRMRITHEYGHVALHIFYTYPEDEGKYVCRATNELGEDQTEANLVCRPLPHLQFQLPAFDDLDDEVQLGLVKEASSRHGVRAKLKGDEIFKEDLKQPPRFLLKMESYPKILAGQGVNLETFVVPVGDPDMKLEWFLNKEPLLFKSSFTPIYDFGFVGLGISKVYPDDFGEFFVRVSNKYGTAEMGGWVGELPQGEDQNKEEEPDLPAWCNKVEKGRLAVECPPEITKHLMDMEVGETETAKLEVHFIGNPKPEVIWTKNGEELVNSRHVQVRDREGRSTLLLINVTPDMQGEYRLVVVSPLGSDLTFCRLSVAPLPKEELMRLSRLQKNGLEELVRYEEDKLLEKKRKKQEKEDKMKDIKEKNKKFA